MNSKEIKKMTEAKRKKLLVKVTEEVQEITGMDPELKTNLSVEKLEEQLKESHELIEDDDPLSDDLVAVFTFLGLMEEEPEEPEEPEELHTGLIEDIEEAGSLKELKEIVKEDDSEVFGALKDQLASYSAKKGLKAFMLDVLSGDAKAPKVHKKPEKKTVKKNEGVPKKKGKGVIATIAQIIEKAPKKKGVTKEQILEKLVEEFPDRKEESMKRTISVQVPARMSKERFEVGKTTNGGYFKV